MNPRTPLIALTLILCLALTAQGQRIPAINSDELIIPHKVAWNNFPVTTAKNQSLTGCNTWTFRVQLRSATPKNLLDVTALQDQGFVYTADEAGANGLAGKITADGQLSWTKLFSLSQSRVVLKKIKFFSNNYLYVIGESTHQVSGITQPFIAVLDTLGNVQWVKQLNVNGIAGSWKGIEIDQRYDTAFSVLMSNDSLVNVSKLRLDGSLVWSKTYKTKNKPACIGMLNEELYTYVAYNETDGGLQKSVVMSLDINGNLIRAWKVGDSNSEYVMESMRMVNVRPRITALCKRGGNYSFARFTFNPTGYLESTDFFTGTYVPIHTMLSAQDEWSEMLASSNAPLPEVYLTRTWPDNYNTPIQGKKILFPYPVGLRTLSRSHDNGFLIGVIALDGSGDIVFTKVDSTGTLPSCGYVNTTAAFTIEGNGGVQEPITALPNQAIMSPLALTVANYSVSLITQCKASYCPPVAEPDTCLKTFFKEYRTSGGCVVAESIHNSGDTLMMVGRMRYNPYDARERTIVALHDTAGRQVDSKVFSINNESVDFSNTIKLRDGTFLSSGYIYHSYNNIDQFIIKYTADFNIIWQKKLYSAEKYRNIARILESQEGDLFCYVADKLNSVGERRHLMKLSSTGDPIWFKSYTAGPDNFSGSGELYAEMVEMGDFIYLKYHEETGDWSPHLIKISKSDGSAAWVKKYEMPGVGTSFRPVALMSRDNHIYMFGTGSAGQVFLKIAPDGQLVLSKRSTDISSPAGVVKKGTDKFVYTTSKYQSGKTVYGLFEIDTSFNILRNQFVRLPLLAGNVGVVAYNDSVSYSVGNSYYQNVYWNSYTLQKSNFNGSFGPCEVNDFTYTIQNYPLNVITKSTVVAPINLPVPSATNGSFDPVATGYIGFYCGTRPLCSTVDLTGPPSICDSSNVYTFYANRDAACTSPVKWKLDTTSGRIRIIGITDTSIRIKAFAAGTFKITASVFANCEWISDSMSVALSITSAMMLNLGADTVICPGNTIMLNARKGFSSYRWQDGSTDSTYIVRAPGLYYVEVTHCNQTFTDSIQVSPHPPIPFDAGPDRIKCNDDTLHLQASAGFLNYTWSPNYNITSTSSQAVTINPAVDTTYFIKAEKKPGCFAYDTVKIKVYRSNPVYLGNDTSFCSGQSILLNAGSGFASYVWNNGSTAPQLVANNAGNYSVTATTQEGCRSMDTLAVLSVYPNPRVDLNDKPGICTGSSVTFDAGNFNTYNWNTGSTARTITVNAPGRYYVTVTDNNNCVGSDTTDILQLLPLPANFLPLDTFICSYGTLELKSIQTYQSYLWNNSAIASAITISKPGVYHLQVTDRNGCAGKDTILVSLKDCMQGFYAPNGFTPNNDKVNETFRPLLFGVVKQYRFTIFNRWGNRVFDSTTPGDGWNGMLSGIPQNTDTYVWICTYQLEGQSVQVKKGTMTLIR